MSFEFRLDPRRIARRLAPGALAVQVPRPQVVVKPAGAADRLLGLPVAVDGIGVVGQYLGHVERLEATPAGEEEVWDIQVGVYTVYGVLERDGSVAVIPVVWNGVAPPDVPKMLGLFREFRVFAQQFGEVTAPKRAIVNLEDVYAGRDLVIRIDPAGASQLAPGELRRQLSELHLRYSKLSKMYAQLYSAYRSAADRALAAESQLMELTANMEMVTARLQELAGAVERSQTQLASAISRLQALSRLATSERELRSKLQDLIDEISATVESASSAVAAVRALVSQVVAPAAAEEEAAPPPPPPPAGGGETGGEGGGGG